MEQRKRFSSEVKLSILRELLENNVEIGKLSEQYEVKPNLIYHCPKGTLLAEEKTI